MIGEPSPTGRMDIGFRKRDSSHSFKAKSSSSQVAQHLIVNGNTYTKMTITSSSTRNSNSNMLEVMVEE